MDGAWDYIRAHRAEALPVVEQELRRAIEAPELDQFFLLDLAFLLLGERKEAAVDLSLAVLEKIDPKAAVIEANWEELFHFVMKLGAQPAAGGRHLVQLDRLFLDSERSLHFFRAPHLVQLTPMDIRCMVYGVAGPAAAAHLATGLTEDPARQERRLQLLCPWARKKTRRRQRPCWRPSGTRRA
jgi:hypothetical protein